MSVIRVMELVGSSSTGWEDAVRQAVRAAAKTVPNITGVEVVNYTGDVDNGEIAGYRADVHIAYAADES